MKFTALLCLLSFCTLLSVAQKNTYSIKGAVTDTMATYKMVNAAVTVLQQQDSTLVSYTRADTDGKFGLHKLRSGKFILLITYPGYADYVEEFTLDSLKPTKDFGSIDLILKSTLLENVIIKAKAAAIKINGDTTEYNAGSYIIQPNSKVEELLKQLPGIQVDRNGKITAHGQTVNKVLLDGEEFFSDDPKLITRNIRGDMVDKVQVYDKKSDEATFTGIDDGVRNKTINIKTKADKKHGYFGKVEAGSGNDGFYEAQGNYNYFSGSQRFAATAGSSNTNKGDMSGMPQGISLGGQVLVLGTDYAGGSALQGITRSTNGGLHYENKFLDNKHAVNVDYSTGSSQTDGNNSKQEETSLPESTILNKTDERSDNSSLKHTFRMNYTAKIDSVTELRVFADKNLSNVQSKQQFTSLGKRNDILLNDGARDLDDETNSGSFNLNAVLSRKLKKPGRTVVLSVRQSTNKNETTGFLNSFNNFYGNDGELDSTQKIDQYKTNLSNSSTFNSTLNITEKFSKALSLSLNYSLGINNNSSDRRSFNKSASGEYAILDEEFSNNYDLDQLTNTGGLTLTYAKGKSNINMGNRLSAVDFKQYDGTTDKTYKRSFINWNPTANFSFSPAAQSNIRLGYQGNTSQPGIEQIQPIRINTNPLYETIGNAALKPSYRSTINLSYTSFKMLSERSIFLMASFGFVNNQITNNSVTDDAGKTTAQAINIRDKTPTNFNISLTSGQKIKSLGVHAGLGTDISGNTSYNYSNGALNKSISNTYGGNVTIGYYVEKLGIDFRGGPIYTTMSSSLQKNNNSQGWGAVGNLGFNMELPGKVSFSTRADYQYTGKTQTFNQEFNRLILYADLRKKFFKSQNLSINLKGNDLLNQNEGFSRKVNNNRIVQESFTTMKRYFLCTLSWDFNKMVASVTKN